MAYVAPQLKQGSPRVIEDKGIYVFTADERNAWRTRLRVQIIVPPAILYKSFKPNEPDQYFGVWQAVANGFVADQGNLRFTNQEIYLWENHAGATQLFGWVESDNLNTNLFAVGNAILTDGLGKPGFTGDPPRRLERLPLPYTEFWFNFVPGCKGIVQTEYLTLPVFDAAKDPVPSPEADGNPKNPSSQGGNPGQPDGVNPDTPTTPPYNPDNQDNGRTSSTNRYTGVRVDFFAAQANNGQPCGSEVTSFSTFITLPALQSLDGIKFEQGTGLRTYCGKQLWDGITVTQNGNTIGVFATGASFFQVPVITNISRV